MLFVFMFFVAPVIRALPYKCVLHDLHLEQYY